MIRTLQILCALGFLSVLGIFCVLALAPPGADLGFAGKSPGDKLGHFGVFFLLGPLAAAAFSRLRLIWIVLVLLLIGAGVELGQSFTGRETSLDDFAANTLGLAAGVFPLAACRLRLALLSRQRTQSSAGATHHA